MYLDIHHHVLGLFAVPLQVTSSGEFVQVGTVPLGEYSSTVFQTESVPLCTCDPNEPTNQSDNDNKDDDDANP